MHDGWVALPMHLRLLARMLAVAGRYSPTGSVEGMASAPLTVRQQGRPARWACRPGPEGVTQSDRLVPTRTSRVAVRVYRAEGTSEQQPVLLYAHGGGWIMGGLDGVDPFCARIAASGGRHSRQRRLPPGS